ncbi:MAG: TRAP transporter substrate-binding protein [Pararhodobacter sp.]
MHKLVSAAAAAIAFMSVSATAQESLIFGAATPPAGPLHAQFTDWVGRINADGAGVVEIDMREGFTMANPANFYDRVKEGVVPIAWGNLTVVGGRFPLSSMVELPYLTDDAETASVAFWRLYEEGLLDEEFHDIVPLFTLVYPQTGIHLSAPLASVDDLGGRRVIAGSQTNSSVMTALGGVPLSIGMAETYEAIQRGTADGRMLPWTAFPAFRLAEITKFHIEAPIGSLIGMVFINREIWEELPEDAREIIMRHSGEEQTRLTGAVFDQVDSGIRAQIMGTEGHTVTSLTPEQTADWEARLAPISTSWAENTPGGAALLERYTQLLEEIAAGN